MTKTSCYDILGITQNAGKEQIKSAFRRLALKYHPDTNANAKNAESIFIIINNAYQILMDDKNRREYDNFINKVRNNYAPIRDGNKDYDPIINKAISEFNYLLWDIDDILRKITDENLTLKVTEKNLYDYLLYFFKYLEEEILGDNYRFLNFNSKKNKIKLHLDIYFNLIRVEIDKYIMSLEPERNNVNKFRHLMNVKKDMITYIGEIYKSRIFERKNTAPDGT